LAIVNITPEIDEAQLEALIPYFYARVREDALIGPRR